MNIGFLGLGKLGLPVALAVESKGHNVFGTDINETTLRNIRFKTLNYKEKGAEELLKNSKLELKNIKEIVSEIPNGANIKFKALGNKTIVTASKAQLNKASNEVKEEIRSNISKFLKDEARANSNLQIEIVKQMHKNGGLTSAVARALAVNFTKPALGAGGGAVFGTLFTDSDEGFRNFVLGGAAAGMTHRVLMRGGIKGIPKPQQIGFAKILKSEYWTNLDRKLRILTSTTQQSKLKSKF